MSKVAITGNASGTGVFTVASPNSNTDRTLTLPDETGTVITTATPGVPVNGPAFSAYSNANQTISASTATKISFNAEEFDTNLNFDSTTNYRFTPTVAGYYQLNFSAQFSYSTATRVNIQIYKNGAFYKRVTDVNVAVSSIAGGAVVYFNGSTDYVEIYGYLTGTGTITINGGTSDVTWFNGAMVRSA